ncbi:GGDEF domain-containing protein [uncultured Mycolicibacterium sp.]|uniref:GGDEF domain-containing protein n=1 Tax=uncultured Mycolicibacterium sp. TaxID=2320817 RepID=UPI0032B2A447
MIRLAQWWRSPGQFRELSGYLQSRGLQRPTRYLIAAVMALFAVVPPVMLASPTGPSGITATVVSVAMSLGCAAAALLWLTRWPTERQSVGFSILATACVMAGGLIATDPGAGVFVGTAFAPLAGYLALFHSARLLSAVLAAATITIIVVSFRVSHGDALMAIGHSVGVLPTMVLVPVIAQMLMHLMATDANNAYADPLTGLPNRRGFEDSVRTTLARGTAGQPETIAIAMVDLDDFKTVNDTRGHIVGDQILIAVGHALRGVEPTRSVVARIGGEEFLVAVRLGNHTRTTDHDIAARLCRSVMETPWGVTASVGLTTLVADTATADPEIVLNDAIHAADMAMYDAKRAGGNQFRRA